MGFTLHINVNPLNYNIILKLKLILLFYSKFFLIILKNIWKKKNIFFFQTVGPTPRKKIISACVPNTLFIIHVCLIIMNLTLQFNKNLQDLKIKFCKEKVSRFYSCNFINFSEIFKSQWLINLYILILNENRNNK